MSAAENKASTQAAYEAFGKGDLEGAMKDWDDAIEWIVPGNSKISGTYRGKDEVMKFFMMIGEKGFKNEPEHFIAEGERVVVLGRVTADGQQSENADVATFRDGKLVKFQVAADTSMQERIWGTK